MLELIESVGNQPAAGREVTERIDRRQTKPRCQFDQQSAVVDVAGMRQNDQSAIRRIGKGWRLERESCTVIQSKNARRSL
jgi:hypothetical protein